MDLVQGPCYNNLVKYCAGDTEMGSMGKLPFLFLALGCFCLSVEPAFAARRIARFFSVGMNISDEDFNAANLPPSSCTLILRNPSGFRQNYEVQPTMVTSTNNGTGTLTLVKGALTGQVNENGGEEILVWEYPKHTGLANQHQEIRCGGSVIAWDTNANERGWLVGSGTLSIFNKSGTAATTGGGFWEMKGGETYQQMQILVGEGYPF